VGGGVLVQRFLGALLFSATLTTNREYTSTTEQYGNLLSAYASNQSSYYEFDGLGSTDALLSGVRPANRVGGWCLGRRVAVSGSVAQ